MNRCAAFFLLASLTIASAARGEPAVSNSKPLLLAHFMPWYVAPPIASEWGWHWTMNHFRPDVTDANGKREIASHYYPLTGPYDSMDADILEYQVLLMKLSGIDGVLVDWYGIGALWDYPLINERTNALFEYVRKADFLFAIVYEDQTITHMISQNILQEEDKYRHAQETMRYLEDTWFQTAEYVKIENRPVLLTFGPQHFKNSSDWENIFSALSVQPIFFTLDNRLAPAAGAFSWPPMWKTSADGVLTQTALREYLVQFSIKSAAWPFRISSAFPAFHDIYQEAGVSEGYGYLAPDNGSTFALTLEQAVSDAPHIIQLVTWNDHGEGTGIEPTEEAGYRYLDMVQDFKRSAIDSTFQPTSEHLRRPLQLYRMRTRYPSDGQINARLDRVFELFIDMQLDSAAMLLDTIAAVQDANQDAPLDRGLSNYPNPFNSLTTIRYRVSSPSHVRILVYNCRGQRVAELVDAHQEAGEHAVQWAADDVSAGIYFYRYGEMSQKCLLLK